MLTKTHTQTFLNRKQSVIYIETEENNENLE